ncbi:MAG: DNA polymerase III subunit chi [Chlamydiota bacterium]
MRVVFFRVTSPKEKVDCVLHLVRKHFEKKESILLHVSSEKSALFLDGLFWKAPSEGFLPHAVVHKETTECIAITQKAQNLNGARFVVNLCPQPCPLQAPCQVIYELEDATCPKAETLAKERFAVYHSQRYEVEMGLP